MEEKKKLFEVILSPSDMLEKELENILGGAVDCIIQNCNTNCEPNCYINRGTHDCPPGMIWNPVLCTCVPME